MSSQIHTESDQAKGLLNRIDDLIKFMKSHQTGRVSTHKYPTLVEFLEDLRANAVADLEFAQDQDEVGHAIEKSSARFKSIWGTAMIITMANELREAVSDVPRHAKEAVIEEFDSIVTANFVDQTDTLTQKLEEHNSVEKDEGGFINHRLAKIESYLGHLVSGMNNKSMNDEMKCLRSVVGEKDVKIKSLEEQLASYKSSCHEKRVELCAKIRAQTSKIKELETAVEHWRNELEDSRYLGSEFEEDCWRLENDINEKAQEVRDLEALLAMKDEEIEKREEGLARKNATIWDLGAKIQASNEVKSQLCEKLADISTLREAVKYRDDEIFRLEAVIDRQHGMMAELDCQLSDRGRRFDEATTSSHADKDAVLCDKIKRIASLEEMVAEKCARIKELECGTVRLSAAGASKEKETCDVHEAIDKNLNEAEALMSRGESKSRPMGREPRIFEVWEREKEKTELEAGTGDQEDVTTTAKGLDIGAGRIHQKRERKKAARNKQHIKSIWAGIEARDGEDQLTKRVATAAARNIFEGPSAETWGAAAATATATSKAAAAARHHDKDDGGLAMDQKHEQDQEAGVEKRPASSTTTSTSDSSTSFVCLDAMP